MSYPINNNRYHRVSQGILTPKLPGLGLYAYNSTTIWELTMRSISLTPIKMNKASPWLFFLTHHRNAVMKLLLFKVLALASVAVSFVINPRDAVVPMIQSPILEQQRQHHCHRCLHSDRWISTSFQLQQRRRQTTSTTTTTSLNLLLQVPDAFFSVTFPVLGILLSISKNFARVRMEERAWEQRLEEGREELLRRDPSLTELDLRRREAAQEWSAYGVPRMQEEEAAVAAQRRRQQQEEEQEQYGSSRRRSSSRVGVLDRDDEEEEYAASRNQKKQDHRMTDEEIEAFELEYGVAYDPYYDDPYTIDELPSDEKCEIDKLYGDRIYPNGEIFYKDAKTGLFYRQGSKPRNLSFFG